MGLNTIHFVYPHEDRINCPHAIGRKVGEYLRQKYNVRYYAVDGFERIQPEEGDILLGHAQPAPFTPFRRSIRDPRWRRIILMCPYNADPMQVGFLDSLMPYCHAFLAITGHYWIRHLDGSLFSHWKPKMRHLDLAVDRNDFPFIKVRFNKPGQRKFLYIGNQIWCKNTGYLSAIAAAMPDVDFGWIGGERRPIRHVARLGPQDFRLKESRERVANYDYLITVGSADANPATILEAMAWGLIPVCTPTSGYENHPGIINIPLYDTTSAVRILKELQTVPERKLRQIQEENMLALDRHYTWERFCRRVMEAIESQEAPALLPCSFLRRLLIRGYSLKSPFNPYRPKQVYYRARSVLGKMSGCKCSG